MKSWNVLPVVRRWRFVATVVGVSALVGGGVLLAGSLDANPAQAFHGVTTVRVLDTREATGTPLGRGKTLDVVIPGLPDEATSVAVNLTVVDGTEGSFLTMYPTGDSRPNTSSINWDSSAAVANSATVQVGKSHSVRIYNLKGTVDVVMDLVGYYAPSPAGGPAGPTGPQGAGGVHGVDGVDGIDGVDGADGVAAQTPQPLYFYASNAVLETILTGAAISFGNAGQSFPSAPNGVTVNALKSAFSVPVAGIFKVSVSAIAAEDNQFSIQVNNMTPLSGAFVFGALARRQNAQTAVLALSAGDSVSILNISSGTVILDPTVGGPSAAINAWIMIERMK